MIKYFIALVLFVGLFSLKADNWSDLSKIYNDNNSDYFDNKLPRNIDVQWANLTDQNDIGLSWISADGVSHIRIDKKTNPVLRQARLTMFHEECHLKTGIEIEEHGPKWRACMFDLASRGAFDDLW